jgi:regulator of ribonuclease activity A
MAPASSAPASYLTADLCDGNLPRLSDGSLQVAAAGYQSFGAVRAFRGRAVTLRVPEDNALVRATLEQPGDGRVLVVDVSGSLRCAVVGDNLASIAQDNGWSGIIVNGCIRDADEVDRCRIGIKALATCPRRSGKSGAGERDLPLTFSGVTVRPGDWIYADRDGWLVSSVAL